MSETVKIELPSMILTYLDKSVKNGDFLDCEECIRYILYEHITGNF